MLTTLACGVVSNPAATPTPTSIGGYGLSKSTSGPNTCDGTDGEFEMQILVRPAEAVGLELVAVESIPFSVVHQGESYLVSGSGDIDYKSLLQEAWGTYTVNMDMVAVVSGGCIGTDGNSTLIVTIEGSRIQMVEVRNVGFQGDYPWEGTNQLNLTFLHEEGATAESEGWGFVLHLNP